MSAPVATRNQPRVQTNYPGSTIAIGLVFVALGGVMFFVIAGRAKQGYVLAAHLLGVNFALSGLLLAGAAFAGLQKRGAAKRARGVDPWHYDNKWDVNGTSDEAAARGITAIRTCILLAFFLLPFHLIFGTVDSDDRWILYAVLGLFDVIIFAILVRGVILLLKRRKFGERRVRFNRFPYYTGSAVRLTFDGGPALANSTVQMRLQGIRETYVTEGSGRSRTRRFVPELLYDQIKTITTDSRGGAVVQFEVTRDAEGTDLTGPTPRYWEMLASASVPGLDYEGVFLLPIYASGAPITSA